MLDIYFYFLLSFKTKCWIDSKLAVVAAAAGATSSVVVVVVDFRIITL